MSGLPPREIRATGAITLPHRDLRREVYWLRDTLETAARRPAPNQDVDSPEGPDLTYSFEPIVWGQHYSRAVQVFALMVVEAALNAYGLLRFDEKTFEREVAYRGPVAKLKILLEAPRPVGSAPGGRKSSDTDTIAPNEEIVQVVTRLAARRNALVHPAAELFVPDETGTFQVGTSRRSGGTDLEAAHAAIADMERFLELLRRYDPGAAILFA